MLRLTLSSLLLLACSIAIAHDHEFTAGLEFHENKGQWSQQVLYRAMTPGGAVFVEPSAFTHLLQRGGQQHARPNDEVFEPYRAHAVRVHFENGRAGTAEGLERRTHYANYFLGNDPAKWAGGVGVFGGVVLRNVWPGIDLHVHGEGGLKYDWVVRPGADPAQIVLRYEGQDELEVRDGLVRISTIAGEMIEQPPLVWNEVDGERVQVRCHYVQDGHRVRLAFPEGFDRRHTLVVDPTVIFSSYSGSFGDNFGFTATYDDAGHLYGGGLVREAGYPITPGVIQSTFLGPTLSGTDMGISKFSPDGTELIWSTYIGGTQSEVPHSMVVNSANELYIMGSSGSADYPITSGAHDASFGGGPFISLNASYGFSHPTGVDIVVTHLNEDATAMVGSTYVGGDGTDGVNFSVPLAYNYGDPFRGEIALDADELPVVASCTNTLAMPVDSLAPQPAFGGGTQDGFIFRMDEGLTTMLFATYAGGSGDDAAYGVQFAPTGEVITTGGTTSADMPMAGAPMNGTAGGAIDGFIIRYAADGHTMLSSTYIGTDQYDQSYFVQTDLAGAIYVVGQTHGAYPVSDGVYANPTGAQFIHKISNDLSTSLWSTRIGTTGTEDISPSAFLVSECGQIYFSGWGGNTNNFGQPNFSTTIGMPVTVDAYQPGTDGSDFYLMVLEPDAASLAYATFFGGNAAEHVDGGTSRFDKDGIVYQAVCAGCQLLTFPTTPGAYSQTNNSTNCNLGVFKIDFEQNVQVGIEADLDGIGLCINEQVVFTAVGTATVWEWDLGDGSPLLSGSIVSNAYSTPGSYTVTLVGTNSGLCVVSDTATVVIDVVAPADLDPVFEAVPSSNCDALEVEFFNSSTGSDVYIWSFGDGGVSTATDPTHSYAEPGTYTITLALVDVVCTDTAFATQQIEVAVPPLELDLNSPEALCIGGTLVLDAGAGYDTYLWSTGDPSSTITIDEPGDYSVEVTDGLCVGSDTITVIGAPVHPLLSDLLVCPGADAVLVIPYAVDTAVWNTGDTGPMLLVETPGTYWFVAIDDVGCPMTDTADVIIANIADAEAIVPNVFTPNGDGENDLFLVTGIQGQGYDMTIYDRWGAIVFASKVMDTGWNGKRDNNKDELPEGTYFVVVTYKEFCSNDPEVTHTGHITLLR